MTQRILSHIGRRLRRLWRREDGVATVEFVLVFPLFLGIMVSGAESGLLMTRYVMLERGLDMAVRGIRLSSGAAIERDAVKQYICDRASVFDNCMQNMTLELTRIYDGDTRTWDYPAANATCVDRDSKIEPVVQFNNGEQNEIMLIRACIVVDLIFPEAWLGSAITKDASGGYQMVSVSAFAIEPL